MLNSPRSAITAVLIALSVGACGGGGGGGGGGVSTPTASLYSAPNINFAPYLGSIATEGVTTHYDITTTSTGVSHASSTTSSRQDYTISTSVNPTSTSSSDAQNVSLSGPGGVSYGDTQGLVRSNGAGQYKGGGVTTNNAVGLNSDLTTSLGTTSLSYSYAGTGLKASATGTSPVNIIIDNTLLYGGQKTVSSDMPTTGTATYSGSYLGTVSAGTATSTYRSESVNGAASMQANFGAATVTGLINNLNSTITSSGIAFSGALSGNAYTGVATLTQPGSSTPLSGYTNSGSVHGAFFGPQASETAGAVATASNNSASGFIFSSSIFGAKKN